MQQKTQIYVSKINGDAVTQRIDEEHENGWLVHSMVLLRPGLSECRILVVYRKENETD